MHNIQTKFNVFSICWHFWLISMHSEFEWKVAKCQVASGRRLVVGGGGMWQPGSTTRCVRYDHSKG